MTAVNIDIACVKKMWTQIWI